jgi:hypothetical protein
MGIAGWVARYRRQATAVSTVSMVGTAWLIAGCLCAPSAIACGNEALRTGASARLPDCRAFEKVTPADKGGAEEIFGKAVPAEDGGALALYAIPRFGPQPGRLGSVLVFKATPVGWQPVSVAPSGLGDARVAQKLLFDTSLSTVMFGVLSEEVKGFESSAEPLLTGPVGGPYRLATEIPIENENGTEEEEKSKFLDLGGSPDLGTIVIPSTDHELLGTPTGTGPGAYDLYEYSEGQLRQVNVTTAGSTLGSCGAVLGYGTNIQYSALRNAVSANGTKVFFTAPDPRPLFPSEPGCEEPSRLFMRINRSETVEVSAPEPGVTPPFQSAAFFAGASTDGRFVLFTTQMALTQDAEGLTDNELYLYDTQARQLTRVSRGETGTAAGNVGVEEFNEVMGREHGTAISDDGSTVYFIGQGQLTADAPAEGLKLYSYDVASDQTTYIGTVTPASSAGGRVQLFPTPSGQFLDFVAGSVEGPSLVSATGRSQVYRYSVAGNQVLCVSCPGSGESAGASQPVIEVVSGPELELPNLTPMPQVISNDGRFVFFNSRDHLSPEDASTLRPVANEPAVGETYEWVSAGTEGCANAGGCQRLLSSGIESSLGSPFLGASADGSNAFFLTHTRLLPSDTDDRNDIYDAHIEGGFAEPVQGAPCLGEACQGQPSQSRLFGEPGSTGFVGTGNLRPPARCGVLARRARRLAHKARKTRKPKLARHARALRKRARRCTRNNRRTSR